MQLMLQAALQQELLVRAGVAQAVLAAIKEISRIPEGRQALVEAGTHVEPCNDLLSTNCDMRCHTCLGQSTQPTCHLLYGHVAGCSCDIAGTLHESTSGNGEQATNLCIIKHYLRAFALSNVTPYVSVQSPLNGHAAVHPATARVTPPATE